MTAHAARKSRKNRWRTTGYMASSKSFSRIGDGDDFEKSALHFVQRMMRSSLTSPQLPQIFDMSASLAVLTSTGEYRNSLARCQAVREDAAVTEKKQHPLVRRFVANAERKSVAVYAGKSFAIARLPKGTLEIRVDGKHHHATHLLWQIRRCIVAQLESAHVEKRAGLRAALRGVDMLLRATFENRKSGRDAARN
jgi:hypothetical protein